MPVSVKITCPECGVELVRKPGGRCPSCGADVREHVQHERERETRIDRIVAVVSTILVVGVSLLVGGCNIVEGVAAYAVAGALMWFLAKKTFYEHE
ncbi:MAG TPA: hypothetical protein VN812_17870 [Candidatus Acidoferrales bacterium]|nr:hypothetical protein [Candidatus Acidoferrales bacterium]